MTAPGDLIGTVSGMSYSSDLTDEQWALLGPVFNAPGKRGPKHAPDLRRVVDAMLYVSHTGCQWRFLPESFGPWTRVWSQFRRWSRNGTWALALTVLHAAAREADGRTEATPSMLVIDTHLARGASNGGFTFHDRGGPFGRTKGAKRIVAVDVTGLPVGALVVPASTHENGTTELMLEHLTEQGVAGRLELVLVDRGVTAAAAHTLGRQHDLELRRVGWDDKQPVFRPIRHAWRVEVAHGRLGRSRRLAKSFENTTTSATGWLQVACIATTLRHLSRAQAPAARTPVRSVSAHGGKSVRLRAHATRQDQCTSRMRHIESWNHSAESDVPTAAEIVVRSRERSRSRMSCRLVLSVMAVALLTACGMTSDQPTDAEATAYANSAPPLGEAVDYFVHTHCGVESLEVDGRMWHAVEPLYGDNGPGDSPEGWGDPYQEGELTLNSDDSITFEAQGKEVAFVPAPEDKPMRMCK